MKLSLEKNLDLVGTVSATITYEWTNCVPSNGINPPVYASANITDIVATKNGKTASILWLLDAGEITCLENEIELDQATD